jgi:hypothetical protein
MIELVPSVKWHRGVIATFAPTFPVAEVGDNDM